MSVVVDVTREPKGREYERLLQLAVRRCKTASVVVRPTVDLASSGEQFLRSLEGHLVGVRDVSEWPGTVLHGHSAKLYEIALDDWLVDALARPGRLYAWVQPSLPEDLCFYRADGSSWLATIAHEADAYLELSAAELTELRTAIPNLSVRVRESGTPGGS
jgi:hypothetical protein